MSINVSSYWKDYELIDAGNYEKLERFGKYIIRRPEPQAIWDRYLSEQEWENLTNAWFRKKGISIQSEDNERGEWIRKKEMPEQWQVSYQSNHFSSVFRLGLTSFKHLGLFPEQADNWEYIYKATKKRNNEPKVLNLFAYTGGASLAARAAGAQVTHVDSVKQVVNWSRENMELSGLDNIRWIVEDAVKYVNREIKRGKIYDGILLDPPAYGRGPDGEKWILEKELNGLLKQLNLILSDTGFLILNLYSMGFSSLIGENLIENSFNVKDFETGECFMTGAGGRKLPLGLFIRFDKMKT